MKQIPNKRAVVLLSGGLDSSTTLAIAKSQNFDCYALSFDYQQRHHAELNAAKNIAVAFKVIEHKIISLDFLKQIGGSALTDSTIAVPDFADNSEIPVTYVPARNTLFLTIALGWAETLETYDIFIGACSKDYSGYPDCRPEYMAAYEKTANLATKAGVEGNHFTIHTPLMELSKAETILKGTELGVDYSQTVSCYNADKNGYACGRCDSCHYRKLGFDKALITDPTKYQLR